MSHTIGQIATAFAAPGAQAQPLRSDISAPDPSRDGFFAHHGLWAPGVRLFRRLGFNAKAAIISGTFLLPICLLGGLHFRGQAEMIDFSAKELEGSAYIPTPVWYGFVAPAGTPPPIVERLSEMINAAMDTDAAAERLTGLGAQRIKVSNEQFAADLKREFEKSGELAKRLGTYQ